MKKSKKKQIYKGTDIVAFSFVGFSSRLVNHASDKMSEMYKFFDSLLKNVRWKVLFIILLFPFLLVFIGLCILFFLIYIFVVSVVGLCMKIHSLIKETRKASHKLKREILKKNVNRVFIFQQMHVLKFQSHIENFEDLIFDFFISKTNLPLKKIISGLKIVYSVGKIALTISEICKRRKDYHMIIELINGELDIKSNWKRLKIFISLHIDVVQEVIDITKIAVE